YARGDYDHESDIDYMVIANLPHKEACDKRRFIKDELGYLGYDMDMLISVNTTSCEIFDRFHTASMFFRNVLDEGIEIDGQGRQKTDDFEGLAKEFLQRAEECIQAAQKMAELDLNKTSASSSYFAVFHAMRAVLALECFDLAKHPAVTAIARFNLNYIKTGVFDKRFSKVIKKTLKERAASDYVDFYEVSEPEAAEYLANAKEFVSLVTEYLTETFAKEKSKQQ
ncbi:MAG: HEPN domain-containing protein, partial [Defluviitaleaceae bacterium]|nr:HEPN domain-containing protein [Defluviitaleaceae bacterium]